MNEWLLLAPLGILALTGLGIMLVDAFAPGRAELASVTTTALLMAGLISVVALVAGVQPDQMPATVRAFLAVDHAGLFSDVVICGGAALSTLLAGGYLEEHHLERGEYYVLVIFSTLGAMILARASDVITLFIGLETMSLGVYCMIAYRRTSTRATEGALKYFLLGSFAAAILLFGTALLYGATGHTELVEIGRVLAAGGADARLVLLAGADRGRPGLQGQRRALPHVDARRLRRRTHTDDHLHGRGREDRGLRHHAARADHRLR